MNTQFILHSRNLVHLHPTFNNHFNIYFVVRSIHNCYFLEYPRNHNLFADIKRPVTRSELVFYLT